jgi:chromosome partitioning protein
VPQHHARVIAVANQKGGVGKSTTAVSLGAAIAELGKRVLVVDLDPQGNASTGLGIRHEARDVTVYDVLAAEAPIDGAIVPTPVDNLFAIPSTIDLAGAEIELVSQFSRELRLRKALEPLRDGAYDYIFLDCPPSLGLLTVNALAAAEELIVPIQCEYYALEGLGQLLRNVRLVQQNVNQNLRLTGIVMTMFDPRTKLSEQVVEEVRRYFGDRVYQTIIPRTVRLSEAPGFGQPITVYDPRSRGAQCYRDLAAEVVVKLPDEAPLPVIEDLPTMSIPAPEPTAARAPRPLVEEDEVEQDEPGVEAKVEPSPTPRDDTVDVEAGAEAANRPAEAVEPQATVDATSTEGAVHAEDEVEIDSRPTAAPKEPTTTPEPEPLAQAEQAPPTPSPESAVEPEPEASPSIEEHLERETPSTPETPADAGDRAEVQVSETAPEPEVRAKPAASDDVADEGEPEVEKEPRKRRWGLFRKGS